ncbi:MAG: D-3-phosphoglycerate dehydrogenase [Candidatus Omnitrophota bacterium]|jgi:D-3-phosphoglycerate dehydrogenase
MRVKEIAVFPDPRLIQACYHLIGLRLLNRVASGNHLRMKKVLIPTKLSVAARERLEQHGGYVVHQDDAVDLLTLAADHADAYAMIVRSEKISTEILDAFPNLKVIIRAGAGYNTIDIQAARKRGIDVMNTPGANSNAVAEEVAALMLADARHLVPADASCRAGLWEKSSFMGREITGKTLGILGMGHIGQLVAKRLSGFEMKVLAFDPVISEDRANELGASLVSLQQLFEDSDYITLHVPENEHTRGMINAKLFTCMKEGATIINCARSGVINEEDLRAAKALKKIRYLNDVYPKDEAGDKSITDVADIMLPHLGASTLEANTNAAIYAAEQLINLDERGISTAVVNRDIPEGLDPAYADLAFTLARLARAGFQKDAKLKLLETSIYGDLQRFDSWLLVPMVCALNEEFDRSKDPKAALAYLAEMGVAYKNRDTDEAKGYGGAITIDLTGGPSSEELHAVSIRGTVAEGNLMVSRINNFDKLYFEPKGHLLIFIYPDATGVLAKISSAVAGAGINIDDVRNPHSDCGSRSIAILKVNKPVQTSVVEEIKSAIQASTGFYLHL